MRPLTQADKEEGYGRVAEGIGAYQGPAATPFLPPGKGVCGAAFRCGETILVPDVHAFPGHIACDARSRSEIVVPFRTGGVLAGVLDVDAGAPGPFTRRTAHTSRPSWPAWTGRAPDRARCPPQATGRPARGDSRAGLKKEPGAEHCARPPGLSRRLSGWVCGDWVRYGRGNSAS